MTNTKSLVILFLAFSAVLSTSLVTPSDADLYETFEDWQSTHGITYESAEEESSRFEIFKTNYAYIQKYNSEGNTAVLGLTKFADLTPEEFKSTYLNNALNGDVSTGDWETVAEEESSDVSLFPQTWDWRTSGVVGPVLDQGQCGSTYAYSVVEAVESFYAINNNDQFVGFSINQVLDCDTKDHGCNGGEPSNVFAYIVKYGLETSDDYPSDQGKCEYNASEAVHPISTYVKIPAKRAALMQAAVYKTPISVDVEADQSVFQFYTSGVISANCGTDVDSTLSVVGWTQINGVNVWICKNSWGITWGDQGYVYIAMDPTANAGSGVCGIYTSGISPA